MALGMVPACAVALASDVLRVTAVVAEHADVPEAAQRVADARERVQLGVVEHPIAGRVLLQNLGHRAALLARVDARAQQCCHALPLVRARFPVDDLVQPAERVLGGELERWQAVVITLLEAALTLALFQEVEEPATGARALGLLGEAALAAPLAAQVLDVRVEVERLPLFRELVEARHAGGEARHDRALVGLECLEGQDRVDKVLPQVVEVEAVEARRLALEARPGRAPAGHAVEARVVGRVVEGREGGFDVLRERAPRVAVLGDSPRTAREASREFGGGLPQDWRNRALAGHALVVRVGLAETTLRALQELGRALARLEPRALLRTGAASSASDVFDHPCEALHALQRRARRDAHLAHVFLHSLGVQAVLLGEVLEQRLADTLHSSGAAVTQRALVDRVARAVLVKLRQDVVFDRREHVGRHLFVARMGRVLADTPQHVARAPQRVAHDVVLAKLAAALDAVLEAGAADAIEVAFDALLQDALVPGRELATGRSLGGFALEALQVAPDQREVRAAGDRAIGDVRVGANAARVAAAAHVGARGRPDAQRLHVRAHDLLQLLLLEQRVGGVCRRCEEGPLLVGQRGEPFVEARLVCPEVEAARRGADGRALVRLGHAPAVLCHGFARPLRRVAAPQPLGVRLRGASHGAARVGEAFVGPQGGTRGVEELGVGPDRGLQERAAHRQRHRAEARGGPFGNTGDALLGGHALGNVDARPSAAHERRLDGAHDVDRALDAAERGRDFLADLAELAAERFAGAHQRVVGDQPNDRRRRRREDPRRKEAVVARGGDGKQVGLEGRFEQRVFVLRALAAADARAHRRVQLLRSGERVGRPGCVGQRERRDERRRGRDGRRVGHQSQRVFVEEARGVALELVQLEVVEPQVAFEVVAGLRVLDGLGYGRAGPLRDVARRVRAELGDRGHQVLQKADELLARGRHAVTVLLEEAVVYLEPLGLLDPTLGRGEPTPEECDAAIVGRRRLGRRRRLRIRRRRLRRRRRRRGRRATDRVSGLCDRHVDGDFDGRGRRGRRRGRRGCRASAGRGDGRPAARGRAEEAQRIDAQAGVGRIRPQRPVAHGSWEVDAKPTDVHARRVEQLPGLVAKEGRRVGRPDFQRPRVELKGQRLRRGGWRRRRRRRLRRRGRLRRREGRRRRGRRGRWRRRRQRGRRRLDRRRRRVVNGFRPAIEAGCGRDSRGEEEPFVPREGVLEHVHDSPIGVVVEAKSRTIDLDPKTVGHGRARRWRRARRRRRYRRRGRWRNRGRQHRRH